MNKYRIRIYKSAARGGKINSLKAHLIFLTNCGIMLSHKLLNHNSIFPESYARDIGAAFVNLTIAVKLVLYEGTHGIIT